MKKFLFIIAVVLFASCSSDDDKAQVTNYEYSNFFDSQTIPQFKGKMNGQEFGWKFGVGTFQMGNSWENQPEQRSLSFSLISENNNDLFVITTPTYDATDLTSFNDVFGLGEKNLGTLGSRFNIRIIKDNEINSTCNVSSENKLVILKTQEILDIENPLNNKLKVWFKIDKIDFSLCNGTLEVNNGLILAEFYGYKS